MDPRLIGEDPEQYGSMHHEGSLSLNNSEAYDPRLFSTFDPMHFANPWEYTGQPSPSSTNHEDREMGSNLSLNSASPASSPAGSPPAIHGLPVPIREWLPHSGMGPTIVDSQFFNNYGTDYTTYAPDFPHFTQADNSKPPGYVDPSLIHPESLMAPYEASFPQTTSTYPSSPALTAASPLIRTGSQSPYLQPSHQYYHPFATVDQRRPSVHSFHSGYSGDEDKEKRRCPHPECGKVFKDLKAHMLTHQNERPEKCPITTCEYHIKGFARKYDKNRHTLTHYKGNMVCGFCSGSGTPAEKSFNRADVFKRHLTAVHGVEQTPPNSRKNKNASNSSAVAGAGKKPGAGYAADATGKCSTCSLTFGHVQDFYEHLDDCVLRVVQQEDPAEAINASRLAEVEHDCDMLATLEKNNLPTTNEATIAVMEAEDEDTDEDNVSYDETELKALGVKTSAPLTSKNANPANGVQKSRGMTHSRGGVSLSKTSQNKGRKNRREFPSSWGYDQCQMTMKKRVAVVFDGQHRLAKDDMMLSTEHEVRVPLSDGKSWVTDLDIQTLRRTEGFLNATEAEKGPWDPIMSP
ncbi:unnamed protein product [Discula destructiva]